MTGYTNLGLVRTVLDGALVGIGGTGVGGTGVGGTGVGGTGVGGTGVGSGSVRTGGTGVGGGSMGVDGTDVGDVFEACPPVDGAAADGGVPRSITLKLRTLMTTPAL